MQKEILDSDFIEIDAIPDLAADFDVEVMAILRTRRHHTPTILNISTCSYDENGTSAT